jgi:hypothetical protein
MGTPEIDKDNQWNENDAIKQMGPEQTHHLALMKYFPYEMLAIGNSIFLIDSASTPAP